MINCYRLLYRIMTFQGRLFTRIIWTTQLGIHWRWTILLKCLLLLLHSSSAAEVNTAYHFMQNVTSVFDDLKDTPPAVYELSATDVYLGLYLKQIYDIDAMNMEMSCSLYLRMGWKDDRLKFNPNDFNGKESMILPDDVTEKIWIPDVFLGNEKDSKVAGFGRKNLLIYLNSSGYLNSALDLLTTVFCPMKLQKYPFDTQMCLFQFESYRYKSDMVFLKPSSKVVVIGHNVNLPQYNLVESLASNCSVLGFPCIEVGLLMRRDIGPYILQVFVPSMLLVIVSWFTFWIEMDMFGDRLNILIVLILTTVVQHTYYDGQVAQVSYIKALDVWMFITLLFLGGAMLEGLVVKALVGQPDNDRGHPRLYHPRCATRVDMTSRILFPVGYIIMCIIYFYTYTS